MSKHSPALYQSHIGELTKALADEKRSTLVEVGLQALANVIRWDSKLATIDKYVFSHFRYHLILWLISV